MRMRALNRLTQRGSALMIALTLLGGAAGLHAQARRGRAPAPAPAATTRTEPAVLQCPSPLGTGVQSRRTYCDVLTGRDPMDGIQVMLPPHTGPVTLTFEL